MAKLDEARDRIRQLDQRLVDTVAERIEAAKQAGQAKRAHHRPIRDYDVEKDVVQRIKDGFDQAGLDPSLGEKLARLLIAEALRVQETQGLAPGTGEQGNALIIGGAGKMGAWFAHFMNGLGYEVTIHDIAGPLEGFGFTDDPRAAADQADCVIISTPPSQTGKILEGLEGSQALILDIASLKAPFQETLEAMAEDHRVTSIHPLWGPEARVLSGKNVVVLDCGNEQATHEAREILTQTAATVVTLPLHLHDRLMAYTLGLPHALNIAYAEVLSTSGHAFSELALLGGPTFLKQNGVASEVVHEDPRLYREIQALNTETDRIYTALHAAVDHLADRLDDPAAFQDAMLDYRDYLSSDPGGLPP